MFIPGSADIPMVQPKGLNPVNLRGQPRLELSVFGAWLLKDGRGCLVAGAYA